MYNMFTEAWKGCAGGGGMNDARGYFENASKICQEKNAEIQKCVANACQSIMSSISKLTESGSAEYSEFCKNVSQSTDNPGEMMSKSQKFYSDQCQKGMAASHEVSSIVADTLQQIANNIREGMSSSSECCEKGAKSAYNNAKDGVGEVYHNVKDKIKETYKDMKK